jgi:hypothetical protein
MLHQSFLNAIKAVFLSIALLLDSIEIQTPGMAHFLCRFIPAQCPFERDICCFGRTLFHIPPLCKFNPFYDQLIGLRFRALTYLADICGEDIAAYC